MRAMLRPVDRARTVALLASWIDGNQDRVTQILDQASADELGVNGLVFGLLDYAATATALVPAPPPDDPESLLTDEPPDDLGGSSEDW